MKKTALGVVAIFLSLVGALWASDCGTCNEMTGSWEPSMSMDWTFGGPCYVEYNTCASYGYAAWAAIYLVPPVEDDDGDGMVNSGDPCPTDFCNNCPDEAYGPDGKDDDGDGVGNYRDLDIDGDGVPNTVDLDDDGDGVPDGADPCPKGSPTGNTGRPGYDDDLDGINDSVCDQTNTICFWKKTFYPDDPDYDPDQAEWVGGIYTKHYASIGCWGEDPLDCPCGFSGANDKESEADWNSAMCSGAGPEEGAGGDEGGGGGGVAQPEHTKEEFCAECRERCPDKAGYIKCGDCTPSPDVRPCSCDWFTHACAPIDGDGNGSDRDICYGGSGSTTVKYYCSPCKYFKIGEDEDGDGTLNEDEDIKELCDPTTGFWCPGVVDLYTELRDIIDEKLGWAALVEAIEDVNNAEAEPGDRLSPSIDIALPGGSHTFTFNSSAYTAAGMSGGAIDTAIGIIRSTLYVFVVLAFLPKFVKLLQW